MRYLAQSQHNTTLKTICCGPHTHMPYRNIMLLGLGGDRTTVLAHHTVLAPGSVARAELVVDVFKCINRLINGVIC